MDENKVLIDLKRYNELLTAETVLQFIKDILFNEYNKLSYDKKDILFQIDQSKVKLLFPVEYKCHLEKVQRKEGINV